MIIGVIFLIFFTWKTSWSQSFEYVHDDDGDAHEEEEEEEDEERFS